MGEISRMAILPATYVMPNNTAASTSAACTATGVPSELSFKRMPTYLYETVREDGAGEVERFEIKQSFDDPPLRVHPKSGRAVRRVISGGMGLLSGEKSDMPQAGPGCGPDTCQCGRFN